MRGVLLVVVALVCLSALQASAALQLPGVTMLTPQNFHKSMMNSSWLIGYTDEKGECTGCRVVNRLLPEIAPKLPKNVKLGAIDCTTYTDFCKSEVFPVGNVRWWQGGHDSPMFGISMVRLEAGPLLEWVKSMATPPTMKSREEIKAHSLWESGPLTVVRTSADQYNFLTNSNLAKVDAGIQFVASYAAGASPRLQNFAFYDGDLNEIASDLSRTGLATLGQTCASPDALIINFNGVHVWCGGLQATSLRPWLLANASPQIAPFSSANIALLKNLAGAQNTGRVYGIVVPENFDPSGPAIRKALATALKEFPDRCFIYGKAAGFRQYSHAYEMSVDQPSYIAVSRPRWQEPNIKTVASVTANDFLTFLKENP